MKSFLLILPGLLLLSFTGWLTDFDSAKQEAAEKNRYILLNFSGSDWCVPCIKLKKEIFETAIFKSFADKNLVLVNADFPRSRKHKLSPQQLEQNETLAEKYNPGGKFPYTVLLTADEKKLMEWDGIPAERTDAFVEQIKSIVKTDQ